MILDCVEILVVTGAVACLELELTAEDPAEINAGGSLLKRLYRGLVLNTVLRDRDIVQCFDDGRNINVLDNASVLAETLGLLFVHYHNPASLNVG